MTRLFTRRREKQYLFSVEISSSMSADLLGAKIIRPWERSELPPSWRQLKPKGAVFIVLRNEKPKNISPYLTVAAMDGGDAEALLTDG